MPTLWRKWIAYPIGWLVLMVIALALISVTGWPRPTFEDIEPTLAADFLGRPGKGAAAHLTWMVLQGLGEITSLEGKHTATPGPGSDSLSSSEQAQLNESPVPQG